MVFRAFCGLEIEKNSRSTGLDKAITTIGLKQVEDGPEVLKTLRNLSPKAKVRSMKTSNLIKNMDDFVQNYGSKTILAPTLSQKIC